MSFETQLKIGFLYKSSQRNTEDTLIPVKVLSVYIPLKNNDGC